MQHLALAFPHHLAPRTLMLRTDNLTHRTCGGVTKVLCSRRVLCSTVRHGLTYRPGTVLIMCAHVCFFSVNLCIRVHVVPQACPHSVNAPPTISSATTFSTATVAFLFKSPTSSYPSRSVSHEFNLLLSNPGYVHCRLITDKIDVQATEHTPGPRAMMNGRIAKQRMSRGMLLTDSALC